MCKTGTFLWGLAAGMVAGAMLEIIILPRPRPRRTAVGKAMQRMATPWTRRWSRWRKR